MTAVTASLFAPMAGISQAAEGPSAGQNAGGQNDPCTYHEEELIGEGSTQPVAQVNLTAAIWDFKARKAVYLNYVDYRGDYSPQYTRDENGNVTNVKMVAYGIWRECPPADPNA
ncbi:hypothetical protein ABZV60_26405 [Streptomyces sp. NPDC004787]|uniref:hypothetical protein n=1 Tax=Streptomyces sp. NPDC004787 TaxID=3154291 RepID=UPI0033B39348